MTCFIIVEGITRELYALLGERAPPIALNENKYKGRPKWMNKLRVRSWYASLQTLDFMRETNIRDDRRMTPFTNNARSDGLVLNHWQRKHESTRPPVSEGTQMDVDDAKPENIDEAPKPLEQEYTFAKYNIKPRTPKRYTDEEYSKLLQSNDWTREETDYLMDLVQEYDLRWMIIADRYEYQPRVDSEADANALVSATHYRTMEQMKARYYFVAAKMLAIEHPPADMSEAEFELHERMLKFDPERERGRKELAALQLNRTADEVREEAMLLEELKRITSNEQNFITERRELYSRLEVPISVGNTAMYQSSQGLSQLLQTLLQADKTKKRRSILGPEGSIASPAGQTPTQAAAAETPTASSATANKKGSAVPARETQPQVRTLTAAEEARYGVQHHERVQAGVQFRSDRAQKLTQAKSNVQTQKLAGALAELEIPVRLFMPTERVCKEFERLIQSVNLLLDARKVAEKVESEIRILEAAKADREKKTAPDQSSHPEVKTETEEGASGVFDSTAADASGAAHGSNNKEEGAEDEGPDETPTKGGDGSHKRSASVLSGVSDKSSKRQRR